MNRIFLLFLFSLPFFSMPAQPLTEEERLPVIPHWQEGDRRLLEIVNSQAVYERGELADSTRASISLVEIEVLEETPYTYRMQWLYRRVNPMAPERESAISRLLSQLKGARLEFLTDKRGAFLQLENWYEVRARLRQALLELTPQLTSNASQEDSAVMVNMLEKLFNDRAKMERFLVKEIQLFHRPYGYLLEPDQPQVIEGKIENPWGDPFPARLSVVWHPQASQRNARLYFVQTLDLNKREARQMLSEVMEALEVPEAERGIPRDQRLPAIHLFDSSAYVYARKSGWIEALAYQRFHRVRNRLKVEYYRMNIKPFGLIRHVDALWQQSQQKYQQRDYPGALTDLDRTIALDPTAAAYNLRGLVQTALGAHEAALQDFNQSLAIHPSSWAYAHRADLRSLMQDFYGAEADFQKALRLDPTDEEVYYLRARMWEQRMLISRSLADMDRAIALNPREASAYAYRASLYKEIGALDAALHDVQEAVKLAPEDPLSYRYKGIIHLSRGEQAESCEAFEKALQLGYTEQYDDEVLRLKREFCE